MENNDATNLLAQPLDLPCGVQLKNRLVKSAMSDSLGDGAGNATEAQMRLYERWAEGGAALSLIGEVQTSPHYPEKPGNLVLVPDADMPALKELAKRGSANGAHIWPQLGHAGALAHGPISTPKGPSPLDVEGLKCDGMSVNEIQELPRSYAQAATLAQEVGFGGVLIHAGHGFLFSQLLSPLFNHRTDAYGGAVDGRFRIIGEVIDAIRQAVGSVYPIGIKINSTDMLEGGLTQDDALEVVRLLDATSVDLIDVSGGTYFPGAESSSDGASSSGPYFIDFAKRAKDETSIPIVLTGGFETRTQVAKAIQDGSADAISLARAMVLNPSLANTWLYEPGGDPEFPMFDAPPRGGVTAWYSMRLTALGEDTENAFTMDPKAAIDAYEDRDAQRCVVWRERFPHSAKPR
ncbi:2,4-dienoyl-CoA reductase-like NADH-dependent reductase (Old Yellow Enzyme family) [Labrenzia sp. EL_208]|nr:2,4-dienoyl-CoA reductase-like NADH-dependent reductase (Old Yellow Enzyme family) [Labrenzia sp. EL_132]MBG6230844.1 2,4-dienoyl-CoA reductase-like NADH-dependent reductase (Old Yellow Enzyme family) [Labrenzia sp. EL_208]